MMHPAKFQRPNHKFQTIANDQISNTKRLIIVLLVLGIYLLNCDLVLGYSF